MMSSSGSSSYGDDSRRSDLGEETQPVEINTVHEVSQGGRSRSPFPSPPTPDTHSRLLSNGSDLADGSSSLPTSRPLSPGFVSSPLNPNNVPRSRKPTKTSTLGTIRRVTSEEALVLSVDSRRGSMILYRLADDPALPAPRTLRGHRDSLTSSSHESIMSISNDSKYPSGAVQAHRGFIPYVYNPELDKHIQEPDDHLYESAYGNDEPWYQAVGWRGIVNISMLVIVVVALLALFICYPVVSSKHFNVLKRIAKDSHINSTGQYVPFSQADANEQTFALPFVKDPEFQT